MANGSVGVPPKAVTAEEHQLTGHAGSVLCARVFRGRLLFSGSVDGTLKVGVMAEWRPACLQLGTQQQHLK